MASSMCLTSQLSERMRQFVSYKHVVFVRSGLQWDAWRVLAHAQMRNGNEIGSRSEAPRGALRLRQ
jgi:hypothetical protein